MPSAGDGGFTDFLYALMLHGHCPGVATCRGTRSWVDALLRAFGRWRYVVALCRFARPYAALHRAPSPPETAALSPVHDSLADGLRDRYVLEGVLGQGGMATVYRALDVKHGRPVALKVLHEDLAASVGNERFEREIRVAARLQHPHILSVFDSGETAGRLWFTMPIVTGMSLRDLLRTRGPLPVNDALAIVREAAQALAYAHREGVLHRDIKPENILVTDDGATLVADFGIARDLQDSGMQNNLTATGIAVGTPRYMAPEQATGEAVDGRADQYALACVAYELLTGEPPFDGATAAALIAARFTTPVPSVRRARADVPESIEAVLYRALSLKPAERFATMNEFARAVAPALSTPSAHTPGSGQRTAASATFTAATSEGASIKRWLLPAGVGAALLLAAAGWALMRPTANVSAENSRSLAVLPFVHQGDSTDAYLTDGITDEIRGKLMAVPGATVIASNSSNLYRDSRKPPQQIAEELGVRYLLTGSVRVVGTGEARRVIVRPELVEVIPDGTPQGRWQAPFDAELRDVLTVQGQIATEVVEAMQVALGSEDRAKVVRVATRDPRAYDAYLRGQAAVDWNSNSTYRAQRAALVHFREAVARDSQLVEAWAAISRSLALVYANGGGSPAIADSARMAAERTKRLDPNGALGYKAMASYLRLVKGDAEGARAAFEATLRLDPNDVSALGNMGLLESQSFGRHAEALQYFERRQALDPRSAQSWTAKVQAFLNLGRVADAREAARRGRALSPSNVMTALYAVEAEMAAGDSVAARAAVREVLRDITPKQFLPEFAGSDWLLDASFDDVMQTLTPEDYQEGEGGWYNTRAVIAAVRGDSAKARQLATQALRAFAREGNPNVRQWYALLSEGVALALLGRNAEALARAQRAVKLVNEAPQAGGTARAPMRLETLYSAIQVAAVSGHRDQALAWLSDLQRGPSRFTPAYVRMDPLLASLRSDPRFLNALAVASAAP